MVLLCERTDSGYATALFAFSKSRDIALDSSDNLSSVTIYDQIAVEVG